MDKDILALLGSTSVAVIVGGVIFSVQTSQTENAHLERFIYNTSGLYKETYNVQEHWLPGLLFIIIPGIIGLITACVQHKCMYVTIRIFGSISLFFTGCLLAIVVTDPMGFAYTNYIILDYCIGTGDNCTCRFADNPDVKQYSPTSFMRLNSINGILKNTYQVRRTTNARFADEYLPAAFMTLNSTNKTSAEGESTEGESTFFMTCVDFEKFNVFMKKLSGVLFLTLVAEVIELVLVYYYDGRAEEYALDSAVEDLS